MAVKAKPKLRQRGLSAAGAGPRQAASSFSPFVMPDRPPAGLYDPALDAQGRASERGLAQLIADAGKAGIRSEDQHTLDRAAIERGRDTTLADMLTAFNRSGQDYQRASGDLTRSYGRLGVSQGEAAAGAGLTEGGALMAALRARQENQGRDQGVLDQARARQTEDYNLGRGRVGDQATRDLAEADRQFGYGVVDRGEQVQRATDENTFFQKDLGAQRFFQAGQQGYVAPKAPSNEFRDANGNPYQVRKYGKNVAAYDSFGRLIKINGRRVVNGRIV